MLLKMPHRRLLLAYPVREVLQRDFATEWNESLRVKNSRPLGEDETRRLLNRRDAA
jgi:putative membrane protein